MLEFILILYIYAGAMASGDSVALQAVPGFSDRTSCVAAGEASRSLVGGSAKVLRFVCLEQRRQRGQP